MSIGFKGGQELSHSALDMEIGYSLLLGIGLALIVPVYSFLLLKKKLGVINAGAVAAAYGSVSAVTFVTAVSFLEMEGISFGGHMVAVMALMEAPSIIIGMTLIRLFSDAEDEPAGKFSEVIKHAVTNGSVILIMGSLIIGFIANEEQAQGIEPFTTDIFKGFLAVFLLDMGVTSGKKLSSFLDNGLTPLFFSIIIPFINGCFIAWATQYLTESPGNRLLFAVLAAGASYIAVPAAMKMAAPKANPGLYIPMALGITFPFNVTLGIPIYFYLIQMTS
jgi:hypothetical protein